MAESGARDALRTGDTLEPDTVFAGVLFGLASELNWGFASRRKGMDMERGLMTLVLASTASPEPSGVPTQTVVVGAGTAAGGSERFFRTSLAHGIKGP